MNFCKEPCEVYGDTVLYLETEMRLYCLHFSKHMEFTNQSYSILYDLWLQSRAWSLGLHSSPGMWGHPMSLSACHVFPFFKCISINKTHQKKTGFPVQFKLAMLVANCAGQFSAFFLVSTASICFFLRNRLRSRNAHHLSGCLYSIVTCWASDFWIDLRTNSAKKGVFVWGQQPTYDGARGSSEWWKMLTWSWICPIDLIRICQFARLVQFGHPTKSRMWTS